MRAGFAQRARIVLLAAQGMSNTAIADPTVNEPQTRSTSSQGRRTTCRSPVEHRFILSPGWGGRSRDPSAFAAAQALSGSIPLDHVTDHCSRLRYSAIHRAVNTGSA